MRRWLVAILKEEPRFDCGLYDTLQILSVTLLERGPIHHALSLTAVPDSMNDSRDQLPLFVL